MVEYNNIVILEEDYNDTISGLKNYYKFFGTLKVSASKYVKGENLICVTSYLSDAYERKYSHINYYDYVSDFIKYDKKNLFDTHSMFFKFVSDKKEAQLIIDDIKQKHGLP